MFYGLVMDTIRDGILRSYGPMMWRRVVNELHLPSDIFDFHTRYDDGILIQICDCLVEILNDGTRETYLEFFGTNFIHYFYRYGFYKILRVAGRTFRDFLYAIDQLHDSNRFTFPQMQQPLFHVTEENETGALLDYKSVRHGLAYFAIGGLKAAATVLYDENNLDVSIQHNFSTGDYAHIVFQLRFNNTQWPARSFTRFPSLPNLNGITFFRVFPFSILMDSSLHIRQLGQHILKLFPKETPIVGQSLDDVFRLIRPDIHVEWNKILSYGRHIVFLMENRLALRNGPHGRIRLKGQMKYIGNQNMVWFLCHPVLGSAEDILEAGLRLNDLNLFDSTTDILITGIHQEQEMETSMIKQHLCTIKSQSVRKNLAACRKKNQQLLCATLPKHVALLIQSGVNTHNMCECQPSVTIMFIYAMNFNNLPAQADRSEAISSLNNLLLHFDAIIDKYDVFKVEIKGDAIYMVAAGVHDQSYLVEETRRSRSTLRSSITENDDDDDDDIETIGEPLNLNSSEIIATLALELRRVSRQVKNSITKKPFELKIGFHSGMAVGGIVGTKTYQYCLFGDTVSIASEMAKSSKIDRIQLSQASYHHLSASKDFHVEHRGTMELESKTSMDTYWLMDKIIEQSSTTKINRSPTSLRCPFSGEQIMLKS